MTTDGPSTDGASRDTSAQRPGEYVVIARRYRPQAFGELIGQEHVARALAAAIETSRVGHAYLFTGARGTGKTSTARILAKALNCEHVRHAHTMQQVRYLPLNHGWRRYGRT